MQMRTQVVNGGLIDFQDNSLQRGAQEYVTPNQYMAAVQPQQPVYTQVASGPPAQFQAQQQQPFMASQVQVGPGGQSYISGPPSFLHMNGITYKPVEDVKTASPVAAKPCEPVPDEGVKTLSEDEFHQAISDHVQRKVDSYMSKQTSHHPRHVRATQTKPAAGKRGHVDEEQAAMRVKAVNASMRGQSQPVPWQVCVNKW
jgi:hypothetical protein